MTGSHCAPRVKKMLVETPNRSGLEDFYRRKIELLEQSIIEKTHNLARLSAQRNTLNAQGTLFYNSIRCLHFFYSVRQLREELHYLQEPSSYVGEVVKVMGNNKALVKVIRECLSQ
jgi:26S proteasome regulatory subunit T6